MPTWEEMYAHGLGPPPEPHPWVMACRSALPDAPARVLDLGCGLGRHSLLLAGLGFEVWSTDIAPTGLALTAAAMGQCGTAPRLALADMRHLPFGDGCFDALVAIHVVYHGRLVDVVCAVAEASRVLRPGGLAIATLISTETWKARLGREVEPGSRIQSEGPEAGVLHHYSDEMEVRFLFAGLSLERLEFDDFRDDDGLRHCHWHVMARTRGEGA